MGSESNTALPPLNQDVLNQPEPFEEIDLWSTDRPLQEAVDRGGAAWVVPEAQAMGLWAGSAEALLLGRQANRATPELKTHDRFGRRVDQVEFHPAWHRLMRRGIEAGAHSLAWTDERPGAHVARHALMYLRHQVEEGASCPLTMTFAAIPSLRLQPELAERWEPLLTARHYESRFAPPESKPGLLAGMAMTERQGGSDVRANITRAEPDGARHDGVPTYRLTGHKWFCSAPMCDLFFVLAQAPGGLSCFLVPRWTPDGEINRLHFDRLKDKLGNRSNASGELRLEAAWAWRVGDEGRGVATIIEMVRHTRVDCAVGSAATLRRAVAEALHHARYRSAFGKRLVEQPLMRNVLADLLLESEAATMLAFRLAESFDRAWEDAGERAFSRIATAIGKYWIGKRAIAGVAEALEVLGGNGYVEESVMPRLYRDVPLNSIWEGSGNVQCLDVLRAAAKEPGTVEALLGELRQAAGTDRLYDAHLMQCERLWREAAEPQGQALARAAVEAMGLALQAGLLLRHAPPPVAAAFCRARLGDERRLQFGGLAGGVDLSAILQRAC